MPSGEKAQDVTALECPWSVRRQLPEAASQRRIVLSNEAESSRVPSGEKAQDRDCAEVSAEHREAAFPVTMSTSVRTGVLRGKKTAGTLASSPRTSRKMQRANWVRCRCALAQTEPERSKTRNTAPGSEAPSKRVRRARPPFTSRRSPSASVRSAPLRSTCRNTAFPNLAPRNRASRRASNEPSAGASITQSRKSAPSSTIPAGEGAGYLLARACRV